MPIVGIDDSPDVVAVLPTMGLALDRYSACVDSMVATSGTVRLSIVVVLNSSTADPLPLEREEVRVLTAGVNLGWAGGLSFGASQSTSSYLWWMQDDVMVAPAALTSLFDALEAQPQLACAAPLSMTVGGNVAAGSCGSVLSQEGAIEGWLPEEDCAPDRLPDLSVLSYLPSRALLVRRTAFDQVHGPNLRLYPAQYVDVDFSFRLKAHGLSGVTVQDSMIRHSGSASTPPLFAQFLHSRNAQEFGATWFPNSDPPREHYFPVHALRSDGPATPRHPLHTAIASDLVLSTAQSASDALSHLGRVFTQTLTQSTARLSQAESEVRRMSAETWRLQGRIDALESSTSWRITSPVRWIVDLLRRRAGPRRRGGDQER